MENLKNELRNGANKLFNKSGLTLDFSHCATTSIYKKGKEEKPCLSLSVSGDHKISLMKLIVYLACIISSIAVISYAVRTVKSFIKAIKMRRFRGKGCPYDTKNGMPL